MKKKVWVNKVNLWWCLEVLACLDLKCTRLGSKAIPGLPCSDIIYCMLKVLSLLQTSLILKALSWKWKTNIAFLIKACYIINQLKDKAKYLQHYRLSLQPQKISGVNSCGVEKNPGESLFKQTKWRLFLTLSHNLLFHKGTNEVHLSALVVHGALHKPSIKSVTSLHCDKPWTAKSNDFMQAQHHDGLHVPFRDIPVTPTARNPQTRLSSQKACHCSSLETPQVAPHCYIRVPINKTCHHSVFNLLAQGRTLSSYQHTSKYLSIVSIIIL